jgi:hypothetical protein
MLERDGYVVRDLGRLSVIALNDARGKLEERIGGSLASLHERASGEITELQAGCRDLVATYARQVVELEMGFFFGLLGAFKSQAQPYLRIARPGKSGDNIGYHKDTWYGGDPREVSAWIPLADVDEGAALRVNPGSQRVEFETEEMPAQCARGDAAHGLGFLYAPKRLKQPVEMTPVPLKFGQMLVMSLGLLHGQEENKSDRTRWSLDCRVAPVGVERAAYA